MCSHMDTRTYVGATRYVSDDEPHWFFLRHLAFPIFDVAITKYDTITQRHEAPILLLVKQRNEANLVAGWVDRGARSTRFNFYLLEPCLVSKIFHTLR